MQNLWRAARRERLWKKFLAYFIVLGLIPLLLLSGVLQRTAENSIMGFAHQSAETAMDLIVYNIDRQFQQYFHLAYFITRDAQLQALAQRGFDAQLGADKALAMRYNTLLRGYQASVEDVWLTGVVMVNGTMLTSGEYLPRSHQLTRQKWFEACICQPEITQTVSFKAGSSPFEAVNRTFVETVMTCRAIKDAQGSILGVATVIMPNSILEQSMTGVLDRKGSYVYVLDEDGSVLYSPVVGEIPKVDSARFVHVERVLPNFRWRVVGMMRVEEALSSVHSMNKLLGLMLVVLISLMITFALLLSRRMIKPIFTLNQSMKRAQQGDLNVVYVPTGSDEINELGASFNTMLEKIRALISQVYAEQKAKRKAEVAALQANIKPHFLYNTLDTICWMAGQYNAKDIVETVEALSTLFRVVLSKGSEVIPIEQEVLHVKSYLQIQKVRYEEQVSYCVELSDECAGYMTQKLILQPLVENALYHGIKESEHNGRINVRVTKAEDALMMRVEDDGIGMTPERLAQVRAALDGSMDTETGAYGIVNVQERLVLNYGRAYGLTIESTYGKGTICTIRHPLITR